MKTHTSNFKEEIKLLGKQQDVRITYTINANITNSMNGMVISRQLQQIKNDREFAYNG